MEAVSRLRKINAAVGVVLILSFTANGSVIITVLNPQLLAGLGTDLLTLSGAMVLATSLAFVGSFARAKLIDKITPGCSMLVGVVGISAVLAGIGLSATVAQWCLANVLNGAVLAIGSFAAAADVTAEFFGKKTRSAFGIIGGASTVVTALLVMVEVQMLCIMDYRHILQVMAAISLVSGLLSVFVLIGRTPLRRARKAARLAGVPTEGPDNGDGEPGRCVLARRHPALALPGIIGAGSPKATQVWHCQC